VKGLDRGFDLLQNADRGRKYTVLGVKEEAMVALLKMWSNANRIVR